MRLERQYGRGGAGVRLLKDVLWHAITGLHRRVLLLSAKKIVAYVFAVGTDTALVTRRAVMLPDAIADR